MNKRRIVLIGSETGERTQYFMSAARDCGVDIELLDHTACLDKLECGDIVKIDPPYEESCKISDIATFAANYKRLLESLKNKDVTFLNSPDAVWGTLDKYNCKKVLEVNGIASTTLLSYDADSADHLKMLMKQGETFKIFIKPRYGSGAAAVAAYSLNPRNGQEALQTSVAFKNGVLCNTTKVYKYTDPKEISGIIDEIINCGYIVEKWLPKPIYNGLAYDLRVVVQFGRVVFIVPRGSKSPITNLHINNMPLDIDELGISYELLSRIHRLSIDAVKCFEGLNYAGVDLLLTDTGGKLSPYIIEINGQGDLIFKDISGRNGIYKEQISNMSNAARGCYAE